MDEGFNLFGWLWWVVPWDIKLLVGGTAVGLALLWAVIVFGWDATWRWVLLVGLTVITLGLYNRAQQRGWQAKVKRDLEAADRLIERARQTREAADRKMRESPDALRADDGFRRD